jgi:hypothetical protein
VGKGVRSGWHSDRCGALRFQVPCQPALGCRDATVSTLLGGRRLGESPVPYEVALRRLANLANVSFLKADFIEESGEYVFHSAHLSPDLSDQSVRVALHEYFSAS